MRDWMKQSSVRLLLPLLATVLLLSRGLLAQTSSTPPDSLRILSPSPQDTLRSNKSGVDTVVVYSAKDSIVYSLQTRFMRLYGKSELKYRAIGLKADRVGVNWDTATLTAEGSKDTTDKKGNKTVGSPILQDGGEAYNGSRISYNFNTQKGKIAVGETEIENGYYHGEAIKKIDRDVLFVAGGRST